MAPSGGLPGFRFVSLVRCRPTSWAPSHLPRFLWCSRVLQFQVLRAVIFVLADCRLVLVVCVQGPLLLSRYRHKGLFWCRLECQFPLFFWPSNPPDMGGLSGLLLAAFGARI